MLLGEEHYERYDEERDLFLLDEERCIANASSIGMPWASTGIISWHPGAEEQPQVEAQIYTFSLEQAVADELVQAHSSHDRRREGQLLGYPETAIEAFLGERPKKQKPQWGLSWDMLPFTYWVFSEEHFKEELKVAQRWRDVLREASPRLWAEVRLKYFARQNP